MKHQGSNSSRVLDLVLAGFTITGLGRSLGARSRQFYSGGRCDDRRSTFVGGLGQVLGEFVTSDLS